MENKIIDRIAWYVLNVFYDFLVISKINFMGLFKNNNYDAPVKGPFYRWLRIKEFRNCELFKTVMNLIKLEKTAIFDFQITKS